MLLPNSRVAQDPSRRATNGSLPDRRVRAASQTTATKSSDDAQELTGSCDAELSDPITRATNATQPKKVFYWRRGQDSNLRCRYRHTCFQDKRIQPLCHPSAEVPGFQSETAQ